MLKQITQYGISTFLLTQTPSLTLNLRPKYPDFRPPQCSSQVEHEVVLRTRVPQQEECVDPQVQSQPQEDDGDSAHERHRAPGESGRDAACQAEEHGDQSNVGDTPPTLDVRLEKRNTS